MPKTERIGSDVLGYEPRKPTMAQQKRLEELKKILEERKRKLSELGIAEEEKRKIRQLEEEGKLPKLPIPGEHVEGKPIHVTDLMAEAMSEAMKERGEEKDTLKKKPKKTKKKVTVEKVY